MACMHWHWHWHCTALALALALALLLTVMLTAMSALALSVKAAMLEADLRHAFRWEDGQGSWRLRGGGGASRTGQRPGWDGRGWKGRERDGVLQCCGGSS